MTGWVVAPTGLIEPVPAPEIYCNRVGAIERLQNGDLCFHLVRDQMMIETGTAQAVVVAHVIGSPVAIPEVIRMLAQCLIAPAINGFPRVVK